MPLIVWLLVTFPQYPAYPVLWVQGYASERDCIDAARALGRDTNARFNWDCAKVRT